MKRVILILIRGYQLVISSVTASHCRFYPSCSHYAAEAIEQHGIIRGSWLSLARLSHCHPFNPGGYDPVPEKETN
jgi:putative membrane protein insertion efficiency factor